MLGSGARASTARASRESSPMPRTWNAASAAGKYCLRCERSWFDSCPRFHTASCCARASTAIAWTSSESAGSGRCIVGVGAQDVRQRHRVRVIGLRPRDPVPLAIAGHRHRVDRVHRAPGRAQARDQQPARGLDRDRDRVLRGVTRLGQQLEQSPVAFGVVADAPLGHQLPGFVHQCYVVVGLRPVDAARDRQPNLPVRRFALRVSLRGGMQRPNRRARWPDIR